MTKKFPKNQNKKWTNEDIKKLKELAKINKTADTPTRIIAIKLGRTESSIYKKAQKLGISLKPTNQSPYGTK
ncbi:MAG TPA: hypothetical protein P5060_00470 [Candidatus Absconditabacterales bacterium]|nr:hypothetical protein [Candidatus Absconditabacterales bacterium]